MASSQHALQKPVDAKTREESPMPYQYTHVLREIIVPIGPSIAYVPLTQGQFALIEVEDVDRLSGRCWSAQWRKKSRSFCAVRVYSMNGTKCLRGMHHFLMQTPPGYVTDHINGNTLDNRRHGNLRIATHSENARNTRPHRDSKFGVKGAYFIASTGKWRSLIFVSGKRLFLGNFETKEEAMNAYDRAAVAHFGEFAKPNSKIPGGNSDVYVV